MKCLVTGATGFIGNRLVHALLKSGFQVNVLARSPQKVRELYNEKVNLFQGDLCDKETILNASLQCDVVFHLAAFANIWSEDKQLPWKTNVTGTENILEASLANQVKKVIFTSSAAVFPPSRDHEILDETAQLPDHYLTDYETTKKQAEQLCLKYHKKGLDVVIVNPPRVFGPGMMNKSNSLTIIIKKYLLGRWRIIPGSGDAIGNYAYIDDVVNGHLLAMSKGISGDNYILGGSNLSFNQFFEILSDVSGKSRLMFHLPFLFMYSFAKTELFFAEHFGKKPVITPPWVKRYVQNRLLSSKKAEDNLGYTITPVQKAVAATIEWLNL